MNPKYYYLALNILSLVGPFIFSFYPKANFSKKWKYVLPAIVIIAIPFVIWDEVFTQMGVWGFNKNYVSGIYLWNLPLEEILFFICIPYACVFTYFALNYLSSTDYLARYAVSITFVIITFCVIGVIIFIDRWYTAATFSLLVVLLVIVLKFRPVVLGRFYRAFIVLLIPFFLVNGILTGSFIDGEIVWYNDLENMGIRIGTIPLEDSLYAMLMILPSILLAEIFESWDKKNSPDRAI